jgi:uncharacterized membrane protein HdeD (DUF308 family)
VAGDLSFLTGAAKRQAGYKKKKDVQAASWAPRPARKPGEERSRRARPPRRERERLGREAKMNAAPTAILKRASGWSIVWAFLLILFGVLALALPWATSIGVVLLVGWLLFISGAVQVVHAFQTKGVGHTVWKLFVAILYLAVGMYFFTHPILGVAAMTLVLAIFFFAEGITDLAAYFQNRKLSGAGWILVDGIVTLILGLMIWAHWPASSLWAFGILVGISMIMTGMTRLMITMATRKLVAQFAH